MQLQALLTASLLLLLFWKKDGISSAAEPGYLDFDNLPETNFSCESKVIGGYYADVETGCQMFHVCTIGQKGEITDIKFLCLNGTVFDQETRVCERLDEVDCSKTESFFDLNLQLYGNKAGPFGIEPENEEIVEEECDPEDEEECQRTEDGGVREEEEEENGGGGGGGVGGGGGEKVPSNNNNNNNGGVIQQTTFSPISVTSTSTKRPNVFSSTSTARVPTTTLQPSTTGQPAFQSGDPDTIAALLALHNAFAQSLQHHDINNKQQQEQQQAQQQEQIEQQQREIEEHQRKQHLQQIHQQKQQAQLQHQQAQLQHHQAQLHHQQQKITQQAAKQAANAYAAAVNSQAPQVATPKPLPPPPPPLPRLQQVAPQQVLQQHVPQNVPQQQQVSQTPQPSTHRFPAQIHYDTSKHPTNVPLTQQDVPQKVLQQHRFPQQQIHYESSKQDTSPQQGVPQRYPQPPQIHYEPSKADASPQYRYPQPQVHYEVGKNPVIGPQQERFGGAYVQSQQNYGQNVRLQSAEQPKPFSFHQYDSQPSTTASPYLLHQLKVNRVKQEHQHNNFPRQAQRSITTPAVAVVTSTSTTTSIRSGKKGPLHTSSETFLGSSVTSSSSEVSNGTTSGEYDEYQEGDVATDPFFQDVPKIGRNQRDVDGVKESISDNSGEKYVSTDAFFRDVPKIVRSQRGVIGVKGSISDNGLGKSGVFSMDEQTIVRHRRDLKMRFERDSNVKEVINGPVAENHNRKNSNMTRKYTKKIDEEGLLNSRNKSGKGIVMKYQNGEKELKIREKNLKIKEHGEHFVGMGELSGRCDLGDRKTLKQNHDIHDKKSLGNSKSYNKDERNVEVVANSESKVRNSVKSKIISDLVKLEKLGHSISLGSDSLGNENIYKTRKLVKREARYVQDEEDDDDNNDDKYVENEEEEENDDNHVGRRKNKSNSNKNVRKSSKSRRKPSKNRNTSKKNDKRNRKLVKERRDRDRDVESLESSRERSGEERSREEEEESGEDVKKVNKKSKVSSNRKPTKITTTTASPVETTIKPKEPDMKNIPLDNNEFTDIIDKVQQTISAKVVSIQQPNIHKNKGIKDNLQLSPEERKYYAEVSAVMSKYIPPPVESESSEVGESTPNMSARDKQRLSMFVTSKEKRKKKKDVGVYVIRNKRQASKEKKQYEVSEVVDEPTTQEPSARRLINQYRTSGIVPSQLISELIQRMDLSSREQISGDAVSSLRKQNQQSDSRRQIDGQVRDRPLLPQRNLERGGVLEMRQERTDPNTQSLQDVISNGGHHRMVLRKGSGRSRGQPEDVESSKPGQTTGGRDFGSSNPEKSALTSRAHPDKVATSSPRKMDLESKRKVVLSSEESLEEDDSDSSMDYSLEKEESNPRPSSLLKNGGKVKDTYAVSEEDVGDEKPSTNMPFLYQDQVGRANTGDERFSNYDSGSSLPIPVPRGYLNDRTSNYHRASSGEIPEVSNIPSGNDNQGNSNFNRGSNPAIPLGPNIHRANLKDRISNHHRAPTSTEIPEGILDIPNRDHDQGNSNFNRGSNPAIPLGPNIHRENLKERISNHHRVPTSTEIPEGIPDIPNRDNDQGNSNFNRGSNPAIPLGPNIHRANLKDRISNHHRVPTSTEIPEDIPDRNHDQGNSNFNRGSNPAIPLGPNIHRANLKDRISNHHRAPTSTEIPEGIPDIPDRNNDQGNSNFNRGSNPAIPLGPNIHRANLKDRISNFDKESSPSLSTSRENLPLESSGRHQEDSSTTNVGSQESTRVRSRPTGSRRKATTISAGSTDSESTTDSGITPVPRRRRPTSRGSESSLESSRSTGPRRRRPTSRGRENLEENIPQVLVDGGAQSRQPPQLRSREKYNLSVGNTGARSNGGTSVVEDGSRSSSGHSKLLPEGSRSIPESSKLIPDNSWLPDSSRSVLESSRLIPESSRPIPEDFRTVPGGYRSVTSRRRPSNVEPEVEEQSASTQQTPRENRISRTRRPHLAVPKESATDQKEEVQEEETTESYDSQAKKLHSQLFPGENFSCEGKIKGGFYADIESDCRGFFICSQGEINGPLLKSHFWCGEATKFNQRSRTCQADYLVACSISTRYFGLNDDFAVPTLETNTFEPQKVS